MDLKKKVVHCYSLSYRMNDLGVRVEFNCRTKHRTTARIIRNQYNSKAQFSLAKRPPILNCFRYTVVCSLQIAYPFQDQIHTLSKMIKTIDSLRYVISFSKKGGPFAL